MQQNVKEIDVLEMSYSIGYYYLEGGYGFWKNGDNKVFSYDAMNNSYIKNCIDFIKRGIKEINDGKVDSQIKSRVKRIIGVGAEQITDDDIVYIKNKLLKILDNKKAELEEVLIKRKEFVHK